MQYTCFLQKILLSLEVERRRESRLSLLSHDLNQFLSQKKYKLCSSGSASCSTSGSTSDSSSGTGSISGSTSDSTSGSTGGGTGSTYY